LAEKKRKEMKRSEKSLHDNLLNEKKLKEDNLRKLRNEEDEELYRITHLYQKLMKYQI
jgi:hypothetical protein